MADALDIQGALNLIAGTSGLAEQGAANRAVGRIDRVDARSGGSCLPTGAIAETFDRVGSAITNTAPLSTGRLSMQAIKLPKGVTVTSITFVSGNTALSAGTNQWFALYDSSRALLGQTTDDTSTAWASTAAKTLNLVTPYVIPSTGLYYLGINVTATTPPSLYGVPGNGIAHSLVSPIVAATSTTGLTGTAPDPAAALSGATNSIWAYVS